MIHHTKNETTQKVGQAVATVIADSINKGHRITTLELVYPRYIHSELMTHRMFSRNASSSRATPVTTMVDQVMNDPVFFDFVGKNKPGMVATEKLTDEERHEFWKEWGSIAATVASWVYRMNNEYGIHKQTLNRVLEPFSRIRTLVTATEWDNFFKLRLAPDAQPEMQSLAKAMKGAMDASTPTERDLHTPYVDYAFDEKQMLVAVARCARVSYARLDGRKDDKEEDLKLAKQLFESGHMSPFEHVAKAKKGWNKNFFGWESLRTGIEKKNEENC